MGLAFNEALTATIARLNAAGLNQSRSPLGVKNESAPRIDRSFAVLPLGLCHALKPSAGLEAPSQALQDWTSATKYLSVAATTLTTEGAIELGPTSHSYTGGGAFLVTSFDITVAADLPLAI
jgi:hypothetical protein